MMMDGYWNGGMTAFGFLTMALAGLLVVVPFWMLLPRFGIPAWLSLAAVFPPLAVLLLWVMAFRRPASERTA